MPFKKNTNYLFLSLLLLTFTLGFSQNSAKFKVVLDAGHGGKDPGAVKNGVQEKDVALDVVLKIGKILDRSSLSSEFAMVNVQPATNHCFPDICSCSWILVA